MLCSQHIRSFLPNSLLDTLSDFFHVASRMAYRYYYFFATLLVVLEVKSTCFGYDLPWVMRVFLNSLACSGFDV